MVQVEVVAEEKIVVRKVIDIREIRKRRL